MNVLMYFKKKTMRLFTAIALFSVSFCAVAQNNVYNAIVAKDGTGQYQTVQSAINAVPDNLTLPWLIFVKNGSYNEQVIVPQNKRFIHLIGQDKEKTIIHLSLNVGGRPDANETPEKSIYWKYSVHNPESDVYKLEGSVVTVNAPDFYSENISYINDFGTEYQSGPQALAMNSKADRISFNNCIFRSFQDTWKTSSNDADRLYVKNCWIEGAVDYFYGGGDALLENCTLYNVRSGSVIVAPCHKDSKYGYIFRDCIVDGNKAAANGKQKLGRPWHNSPIAIFINTTMRIPIAPEGWTNMGTIPGLFAEYNSIDSTGKQLDLSKRKTEYQGRDEGKESGSCRATITKEEADRYVYGNIISGSDNWNPRLLMKELPALEDLKINKQKIQWNGVQGAIGYIVFQDDKVIEITKNIFCNLPSQKTGTIKVCPINQYGSFGKITSLTLNKLK